MIRLSRESKGGLRGHGIVLLGTQAGYLDYFAESLPELAGQVEAVYSLRPQGKRERQTIQLGQRELRVQDGELLRENGLMGCVPVIMSDYEQEVLSWLYERLGELPEQVYWFASRETAQEIEFRERYADEALQNWLIFRSGPHEDTFVPGMDFADNARALFEYMLLQRMHKRWRLIWLVKEPSSPRYDRYRDFSNVEFLSFDWPRTGTQEERERYYRAMCLAKFIFFTDAYGFARRCRQDQVRVQLWHGCGIKRRVNFTPCENRYEYTTVISKLYADLHQRDYGLRPDQMLVTGYPKEDWLYHPVIDFVERFHLPQARKYIFWLPTFRTARAGLEMLDEQAETGEIGLPLVYTLADLARLDEELARLDIVLIVKLHPFQRREVVARWNFAQLVCLENEDLLKEDVQINELLACADALISDYSSAAIDFTLLDKPIAFTLDDYEIYGGSRGFNWPNIRDWLPGVELFTFEDMMRFVREVAEGIDSSREKRHKLDSLFHSFHDDKSSERVLKALGIE